MCCFCEVPGSKWLQLCSSYGLCRNSGESGQDVEESGFFAKRSLLEKQAVGEFAPPPPETTTYGSRSAGLLLAPERSCLKTYVAQLLKRRVDFQG